MIHIYKKTLTVLLVIVSVCSCSSSPDAQSIINQTIEKHGGKAYQNSRITFSFRDVEYTAEHQAGTFIYTRTFPDSLGGITDTLTNDGLWRSVEGERVKLSPEDSSAYTNSVNSVIYFALLPFKLNDEAVNKKLLGKTSIRNEPYYEIEVTFDQQGGGTDYEDRYIYWIHRQNYTMDYLAYRFHVDEGGTRFRQAYNARTINGIRFADYHNFGSPEMRHPLSKYDAYFESDTLSKVSEINLENIRVQLLD